MNTGYKQRLEFPQIFYFSYHNQGLREKIIIYTFNVIIFLYFLIYRFDQLIFWTTDLILECVPSQSNIKIRKPMKTKLSCLLLLYSSITTYFLNDRLNM